MRKLVKPVCWGVILALVLMIGTVVLPVSAKYAYCLMDFTGSPTSGSAPLTVNFTADLGECSPEDCEICWDFGDGDEGSGQTTSHTYTCAGVYDVTCSAYLLYTGSSGFFSNSLALAAVENGYSEYITKEDYITVKPVANFTASPTIGQAPLTVQFRDKSIGLCSGASWHWSFGDGDSSSSRHPSHTYANAGTYTVSLTVSGSPSDTLTRSFYIIVDESESPPNLVIHDLKVTPTYAQSRQAVYITATVANEGGAWGSDDIELLINQAFEQSTPVGLAAGTSQTIAFTVYKTQAREYQVTIGDATGTFYVAEEAAQPTQRAGLLAGGTLDTGGIIAIIVIGVILVGGVVVVFLFAVRR